ncbi:carbohydrate kinase [Prauserella marina]|uniref:Sugar (Pentulose or hexulose) kinase n=1 Tax=Prauserella marina TaxID=530584 RepID=A0A222VWM6_9PSEU|nr:FGGY family carbohydrate kinase [Prauserella marina]ASR38339.1 carbohydrate kinase [Prauserella marina]PWV78446.1 sugar (pentulose or hexulose) kinase [Prauserella marina]SDC86184.1 Sugar (pentulose or hexulose) kinase [Prauserella marina]
MSTTIGIDVATAGVRAVAVNGAGAVLASASARLPAPHRSGDGRSEQDASSWWPAVEAAMLAVTSRLPCGGDDVSAVAVAATSGTIVAVDAHGAAVGPALMYDDRRGAAFNAKAADIGSARWHALGRSVSPTDALGRIAWLRDNVPSASGIRHTADVIAAALTGTAVATDSSHALKSGYDALRDEWPDEVFASFGVPQEWLPDVVPPTTVLGTVNKPVAGLPSGCLVVAGMTDGCAGQLACGAVEPGQFAGILGTTYVLKGVTEKLVPDPTGTMYSHRHPSGWWLPGGASNTGGECVAGTPNLAELDAAAAELGPASVVAYPLCREGERFPFGNKDARGFVIPKAANDIELHRARLEGVAFVERLAIDHVRRLGITVTGPVLAAGGGSKSPLWNRIRATVNGLGIQISADAETGYGAAVLAAAATVRGGLTEAGARTRGTRRLVEPDATESAAMTASYHRFCTRLHEYGWIDDELCAVALR